MNKWNKFFEKQALEDLKAPTPPNPFAGDVSETETEKAGENAEKALNEQNNENENENKNESEKKGTEENENSEQETGRKETV